MDRRRIAADVGGLFARAVLERWPQVEEAIKQHPSVWIDGRVILERTKAGRLRLRFSPGEVKHAAAKRSTPVVIPIDDESEPPLLPR